MANTRTHIETLEREAAERSAKLEALRALETAETTLAQVQAETGAAQQALASCKTQVLAEQARVKELEQAQQDARAVLQALHREREAVERELLAFSRQAEQQDRDFVARLTGVIPAAPELTEEEAARA